MLAALLAAAIQALLPLRADGTGIVDAAGRPIVLRGTNLGGGLMYERWLAEMPGPPAAIDLWRILDERFGPTRRRILERIWRRAWIGEADIAACARLGMNCLRLPFGYWVVADWHRPWKIRPEGLRELDRIAKACARHGIYLILDFHGLPGGQSTAQCCGMIGRNELWAEPANLRWAAEIWRQVARRFRGRPEVAAYDLMNEPMGAPDLPALLKAYDTLYRAVRSADPDHMIIIEDGYKGLERFPPPEKVGWSNVAYSLHFYPFGFTGDARHIALIGRLHSLRRVQLQRLRCPIIVGEFSAVSMRNGGTRWYRRYIAELNSLGWSWLTWCWKHPCPRPRHPYWGDDIWGIANQWKGPSPWRPPDIYRDCFARLALGFRTFHLDNWGLSPILAPLIAEGLRRPVSLEPAPPR